MKATAPRTTTRSRDGRYAHEWAFIGGAEVNGVWHEVAECQHCGKVTVESPKAVRTFKNRELARAAGAPLLEGY